MNFIKTKLDGVYIIEPKIYPDSRGYFFESYNELEFQANGIPNRFVQDNQSKSVKGVLRGLHFQDKFPQGKLVRVIKGEVFDVALDIRENSDSFGKLYSIILSKENGKQFYIPPGFAHGFIVLSDEAEFCYKVTDFYHPDDQKGIAWNDPYLNIKWPIKEYCIEEVILSDKDQHNLSYEEFLKLN